MRLLITGGAGYLGSVLARLLLTEGHDVRILDSLLHGGHAVSGLYLYDNSELVLRCGSSVNIPSNSNPCTLDKSDELLTVNARTVRLYFRAQRTIFSSASLISM